MVNIAWKSIKGYGPYAYLQHSVKGQDGAVTSKHLAYPGSWAPASPTKKGQDHQ